TKKEDGPRLVVMSATLESDRLAAHLGATKLEAEGRLHEVAIHHVEADAELPDGANLAARMSRVLARVANDPGDVLAFLPGKGEIDACERELRGSAFDVIPLHGGLSLAEQKRAFAPSARRKLILATNVAETSITLPGVGVVIDSG